MQYLPQVSVVRYLRPSKRSSNYNMAAENPNPAGQPLFIVDRDWLRQGPKARKSWTGNVRNRSLYGLAIQATQYDVPGRAARQKSQTRLRKTDREKQIDATDSESTSEPEQVLSRATTPMRTQSEYAPDSTMTQNQKLLAVPGTNMLGCARSFDSWPENPALHPPISTNFPGLRYVRGLECYLDFCEFFEREENTSLTEERSRCDWECTASYRNSLLSAAPSLPIVMVFTRFRGGRVVEEHRPFFCSPSRL